MGRILIPKLTGIPVATTNQFTVSNSSISQVGGNYTKVTANSYQVFGSSKYLFWGYSEPNRWTLINFTNGFFATNPTMSDGTKIPTSDWPNGETISALSSKISIKKQNLGGGKINIKSSAIGLNALNIRVTNGPSNAPWGVGGSGPCGNDFQLLNNQNGIWSQGHLSCDFFIAWDNKYGTLPYKWRLYYDSDGRLDYAEHPTATQEALPSKGWDNGMTISII
jgi:hypothetical protein